METLASSAIEWGVAARSLLGQSSSGDRHIVKPFPRGVLLAAVEGLGHGDEAASAARIALATLADAASSPCPSPSTAASSTPLGNGFTMCRSPELETK